jgi:integrase/recombinase XerD
MVSAVVGFYEYHARNGIAFARALVDETRSGYGGYRPFLAGIARTTSRARIGRLPTVKRLPQTLTLHQVEAIIRAQQRLRDRFLFALLFHTGMRIGQALGLRHEDVVSWENRIEIVPREDNANRARGKHGAGSMPVSVELLRLFNDYMHEKYGDLDSDYVFVNLWGGRIGRPMTYDNVHKLVARTERRVGFAFTVHMLRHTYATLAAREGVPIEVISRILTHTSVQTTTSTYVHATPADIRRALARAGVLDRVRDIL